METLLQRAEKIAAEAKALAERISNDDLPRQVNVVYEAVHSLVQLTLSGSIPMHADISRVRIHVVVFECGQVKETHTVFFSDDNALSQLLEIEDKLLELIAEAKDKAEVAACL